MKSTRKYLNNGKLNSMRKIRKLYDRNMYFQL